MSNGSVTRWLRRLQAGDAAGAQPLFERYVQQLVRLCESRLAGRRLSMQDGDDLASIVFAAFVQGALNQRFPRLQDRHDLWKLLMTISARRVANALRDERRDIRGGGRVVQENVLGSVDGDGFTLEMVMGDEPAPELAEMLLETLDQLDEALPDAKLRKVAEMKMQGYLNAEIAQSLGCTHPTIERKLRRIRSLLKAVDPP